MEEQIKKDLKYYTDFLISKWKDEIECLKWSINRNEKYLKINKKDIILFKDVNDFKQVEKIEKENEKILKTIYNQKNEIKEIEKIEKYNEKEMLEYIKYNYHNIYYEIFKDKK